MEFKENSTENVRYIWSVLCTSSILDSDTQNLTINNVLESVSINVKKETVEKRNTNKTAGYAVAANLHIVSKLIKKTPNKDVTLELKFEEVDPDGKTLSSTIPQKIDFKRQYKNLRWRTNFTPLLVNRSGDYHIRVLLKESDDSEFIEVDRIPLELKLNEELSA
jgi:hypothetical protein